MHAVAKGRHPNIRFKRSDTLSGGHTPAVCGRCGLPRVREGLLRGRPRSGAVHAMRARLSGIGRALELMHAVRGGDTPAEGRQRRVLAVVVHS